MNWVVFKRKKKKNNAIISVWMDKLVLNWINWTLVLLDLGLCYLSCSLGLRQDSPLSVRIRMATVGIESGAKKLQLDFQLERIGGKCQSFHRQIACTDLKSPFPSIWSILCMTICEGRKNNSLMIMKTVIDKIFSIH